MFTLYLIPSLYLHEVTYSYSIRRITSSYSQYFIFCIISLNDNFIIWPIFLIQLNLYWYPWFEVINTNSSMSFSEFVSDWELFLGPPMFYYVESFLSFLMLSNIVLFRHRPSQTWHQPRPDAGLLNGLLAGGARPAFVRVGLLVLG